MKKPVDFDWYCKTKKDVINNAAYELIVKEDFGQNVRYYRKEKKSTLEAAAELCDITSDKITRFSFERNLRVFC